MKIFKVIYTDENGQLFNRLITHVDAYSAKQYAEEFYNATQVLDVEEYR